MNRISLAASLALAFTALAALALGVMLLAAVVPAGLALA
jgi:hypothetical protein